MLHLFIWAYWKQRNMETDEYGISQKLGFFSDIFFTIINYQGIQHC
jgi:hypothetical protein